MPPGRSRERSGSPRSSAMARGSAVAAVSSCRGISPRRTRMRGSRVLVAATRLAWRAPVLDGSQEAGLGAAAGREPARTRPGPRLVAGDDEFLQRLLTGRASLHMVLDGLPLPVVELLIQQAIQLVERTRRDPSSILSRRSDARFTRVETPRDASSRARTSLWRCFITWLLDTNTAATFMPSRAAASAPERPSIAVRR